ncbi:MULTISPECIES: DUF1491 family protein [unclassified Chelatococcus]|uniref:DUF1491 family protein n=1 Tax=unclassified Chelatococcus TaxID=2638111 RepID=UPI001BCB937A|nr:MULTISPECIES: DUF1491 family protein [unclassified Chelatococcus]MBS7698444.1 DUF1491 family protein [Chelatococcus sp. YT9]MBX3559478.1 DUF1491 family protein [Chelatococcus sp.]
MRLRTDFWVPAYIRRCSVEGAYAVLRRRGAAEAGAVFIKVDPLDGTCALYGPAPQSLTGDQPEERFFLQVPLGDPSPLAAEEKLQREITFDPDLWIVEVEDREGRHFLNLAKE